MRTVFNITIIFALITSCGQSKGNENNSQNQKPKVGIDVCKLSKKSPRYISLMVPKKTKEIINSIDKNPNNEECILYLIDKLIQNKPLSEQNLLALESLNKSSDGFLSEYFMEGCLELLYNSNPNFIDFLRSGKGPTLEQSLIDGLSMEVSLEEIKVESFINANITPKMTEENKQYLLELTSKVDPTRFD